MPPALEDFGRRQRFPVSLEEIHAFADTFCRAGIPLARITGQGHKEREAWANYASRTPIQKAELNFTRDTGKWQERKWETLPARVDAKAHRVTATLPEGTRVYYLNLIDERNLVVSTEHIEVPAGTV